MARQIKVLFICTANACRSQMAEALLRHFGWDRFEAASAGAHPVGYIHPLAIGAMEGLGIPMTSQRSKSWDEFANTPVDLAIMLCDSAAQEPCPAFGDATLKAHWSTPDPVALMGSESTRELFAVQVAQVIQGQIKRLIELDFKQLSADELHKQLEMIGETERPEANFVTP